MRFLLVSLLCLVPLCAQPPQEAPKKGGGGGGRAPQNLKVLKVEGPEIGRIMRGYTVALGGVRCDHCHVQGNFASDENPKKDTARMMIRLVQDINSKFPGEAKEHVTCYTCHNGAVTPKTAPPPAAPAQ